ncbi:unnamed protein product [Thlaspi arvense]|uniref:Uncharacterized protein n=1 Tax=Thlaspi arvense TaxID=13288 RepID=A0AAU9SR40_THLAR|nr:unnamed protein product [Thlaspi arvense]
MEVYLHDDPEFITESHHQMLWSLLGSKEDAHDSMVYSYRHGFSDISRTRLIFPIRDLDLSKYAKKQEWPVILTYMSNHYGGLGGAAYLLFYGRVKSETETKSAEMSRTDIEKDFYEWLQACSKHLMLIRVRALLL